eukprot:583138-Pleurochrysis_carterae.AAC.2
MKRANDTLGTGRTRVAKRCKKGYKAAHVCWRLLLQDMVGFEAQMIVNKGRAGSTAFETCLGERRWCISSDSRQGAQAARVAGVESCLHTDETFGRRHHVDLVMRAQCVSGRAAGARRARMGATFRGPVHTDHSYSPPVRRKRRSKRPPVGRRKKCFHIGETTFGRQRLASAYSNKSASERSYRHASNSIAPRGKSKTATQRWGRPLNPSKRSEHGLTFTKSTGFVGMNAPSACSRCLQRNQCYERSYASSDCAEENFDARLTRALSTPTWPSRASQAPAAQVM